MLKRRKDKTVAEKGNMKKRRRHRIKLSKINRTIENGKYEIKRHSVLRTKLTKRKTKWWKVPRIPCSLTKLNS